MQKVKQGAVAGEAIAPNLTPVGRPRQCVTQPQPQSSSKTKGEDRGQVKPLNNQVHMKMSSKARMTAPQLSLSRKELGTRRQRGGQ